MKTPIPTIERRNTHEVLNQPPPFEDVNLFTSDRGLAEAFSHAGGDTDALLGPRL